MANPSTRIRAGKMVIWLHRVAPDLKLVSPRSLTANSSGLVVYVDDVDAHYQTRPRPRANPKPNPRTCPTASANMPSPTLKATAGGSHSLQKGTD